MRPSSPILPCEAIGTTSTSASPRERREMCGSVPNKANELLREPVLRNILGQSPNKLDIRSIIEHRGILIVNLAKSEIGTEYARLIGAFIVSQIALAAAARMQALSRCISDDPERVQSAFPDFYTFVDEFQDLATAKFDDALSQSRNGRVSFALFNQFQAQLSDEMKGALFGNVGSLIAFEVSADDARQLSREFDGHIKPEELTSLRQWEIALKLPKRLRQPIASLQGIHVAASYGSTTEHVAETTSSHSHACSLVDRVSVSNERLRGD